MNDRADQNPYLLLTPGPLSTSPSVRQAMLRDWCTWDKEYNEGIVQVIRRKLVDLATDAANRHDEYTAVLMQGSGTFCVESTLGTTIPRDGKLLVLANGAYGQRIAKIAQVANIPFVVHDSGELEPPDLARLDHELRHDAMITHVAMVHGETTTGMLNPIAEAGRIVKQHGRSFLVDAMCTFGGVPLDVDKIGIDAIVSSANKCIQGVPGFGFVVARREYLAACNGRARSLSLDLYDQWRTMEEGGGKWRFTSPTHTVRAFAQALQELEAEGGVAARNGRYTENQRRLSEGMQRLGFRPLIKREYQSPIITAFFNPEQPEYRFEEFYARLKEQGFVIYPGKVTNVSTFRIGSIGEVYPDDVDRLLTAVELAMYWNTGG
jgi:2-aminoethylphosphonate-pyruvate transaminase